MDIFENEDNFSFKVIKILIWNKKEMILAIVQKEIFLRVKLILYLFTNQFIQPIDSTNYSTIPASG